MCFSCVSSSWSKSFFLKWNPIKNNKNIWFRLCNDILRIYRRSCRFQISVFFLNLKLINWIIPHAMKNWREPKIRFFFSQTKCHLSFDWELFSFLCISIFVNVMCHSVTSMTHITVRCYGTLLRLFNTTRLEVLIPNCFRIRVKCLQKLFSLLLNTKSFQFYCWD